MSAKSASKSNDKAVADRYQYLSDIEHIRLRAGMFIGAREPILTPMFIASDDDSGTRIVKREMHYSAGLERIYEEILLNAYDRTIEGNSGCTEIAVSIDAETGTIVVGNNGDGIPIVRKEELDCYLPEMLFGRLRTSSNYDESVERLGGGQNGYGAKLCVIFSTEFKLETADAERKKIYKQSWFKNMSEKTEPEIKASSRRPFTRITFKPDLKDFKMDRLSDDVIALMKKRLIDIGFATAANVKTYYNGKLISIKKPDDYMRLYSHPSDEKFIIDSTNERWTVGVVLSNDGFQHASFVNGIHTSGGGSHVDHVMSQIVKVITEKLKSKKIDVRASDIKNKIFLFLKAAIVNPGFDSQTKECLKMPVANFGSRFVMSEAFQKKLLSSAITKSMTETSDARKLKDLSKTSGVKTSRIMNMPTLEDATFAGTAKSSRARLILTEGLSARTFAISALNVIGRDCYGVFPLKGKMLNVRNVSVDRVSANEEIKSIVKILGLKYDCKYETESELHSLRYGGVIALTDADADGFHITGLIINYFHHFWPALISKRFVSFCITPIVKVFKGKEVIPFYTLSSYEEWVKKARGTFRTKYFKGLGTSTAAEAREALKDIDNKLIAFDRDDACDDHVSMAFNNKRADDRKRWLLERYDPESHIDRSQRIVPISDFINYELSHFSTYDCARSIPNIMDGLKPSQRKILHIALKFVSKNEMKVAQLAPKVSELTDYHHGEQSLMDAIIGMAQDFVGSNNINLLLPLGGFGTRLVSAGGDAASPRYIFTKVNPIALKIFNAHDAGLLKHHESDGVKIEPEWFAPIIPMILINGTLGIGTGFSSTVLQYNPVDIIKYLKSMLLDEKTSRTILPWYRGFKGVIEKDAENKFTTYGVWEFDDRRRSLRITELPINTAVLPYKTFCEELLAKDNSPLVDAKYDNTDVVIDMTLTFTALEYQRYKKMSRNDLAKTLKLSSKLNSTNMYLFDAEGRIRRFESIYDILNYYFERRLSLYEDRRNAMIAQLAYEILILTNKAAFITAVKNGAIDQRKMTEESLLNALKAGFADDPKVQKAVAENRVAAELRRYEYLIGMTYRSFTNENAKRMKKLVEEKQAEMELLQSTNARQMWVADLSSLQDLK